MEEQASPRRVTFSPGTQDRERARIRRKRSPPLGLNQAQFDPNAQHKRLKVSAD